MVLCVLEQLLIGVQVLHIYMSLDGILTGPLLGLYLLARCYLSVPSTDVSGLFVLVSRLPVPVYRLSFP